MRIMLFKTLYKSNVLWELHFVSKLLNGEQSTQIVQIQLALCSTHAHLVFLKCLKTILLVSDSTDLGWKRLGIS